ANSPTAATSVGHRSETRTAALTARSFTTTDSGRPPGSPRMPRSTKPRESAPTSAFVQVRGAREHNLRDVDVDIPRDALVVFTGISGSGKSSLAFGTLFAEAQRRYLDSISPYARRLIDQAGVPDVDSIE